MFIPLTRIFCELLRYEAAAIGEVVVFADNIGNIFTALWSKFTSSFRGREKQSYTFSLFRN